MPIKQTTPQSDINNAIDKQLQDFKMRLARRMAYVGSEAIREARRKTKDNDWQDRTGNLRSSIGYLVTVNGEIVYGSDFATVLNGQQGSQAGYAYAKSLVGNFRNGIVLIVVAGMEYASYVAKDRNVLASSQLRAEELVPQILKELGLKEG